MECSITPVTVIVARFPVLPDVQPNVQLLAQAQQVLLVRVHMVW
jgi:hypothetical protein